ncbi:hypothetical protein FF38_14073 [Lucilia cuprina]|uniref:CHHC U11-48K-type domain-containing protein n=1 Tax=Lucilia cuprina TaxID=7375 RepID=A0A0L0C4E6_LUCCU|nr:Gametocyte-specific factor 1 like protein [Lucilia cuprina]KNC27238.1 hypothetical protein FF38_14073 [Lucilia cuprina]
MENQELLQCPYEKNHSILKHRMQVHLTKCRRNHANVPKVTCPFNVTHVLNKPELEFHVMVCAERKTFENFRNIEEPITKPTIPPPMPVYESEENWDNEDAPTYNPQEYLAKATVLRNLQGATPSERKKFRQQERLRYLGIDD